MTEIAVSLPEDLAREVREAGLLAPEQLERLLREEMEKRKVEQLFEAVESLPENEDIPEALMDAITEEVRAVRRERRAQVAG